MWIRRIPRAAERHPWVSTAIGMSLATKHHALSKALHAVDGMIVLSGYACQLYDRELYPGWERHQKNSLADGARPRIEVIWLNPACSRARKSSRSQQRMFE